MEFAYDVFLSVCLCFVCLFFLYLCVFNHFRSWITASAPQVGCLFLCGSFPHFWAIPLCLCSLNNKWKLNYFEGVQNLELTLLLLLFRLSGCSDCSFHLCTPTKPVILPGNEKLVLAPYHTYYPTLEEHLRGPWGIPIEPNLWNDPLVLGKNMLGVWLRWTKFVI